MQIAVASTDGVTVNQHFGQATKFMLLEVIPDEQILITVKHVTPLSVGDKDHAFDADRFAALAGALRGCERVYCQKIGDRPFKELKKLGIEAVTYQGHITNITI